MAGYTVANPMDILTQYLIITIYDEAIECVIRRNDRLI